MDDKCPNCGFHVELSPRGRRSLDAEIESQQARIELLEKVLEAAEKVNTWDSCEADLHENLTNAIADCEPSTDSKALTESDDE